MGYSFQLAARVLLYTPSHKQDSTYHSLCYTSRGALAGMRNSSNDPPWMIDSKTHRTTSDRSYHGATSRSTAQWVDHEGSIRRPIAPRSNAPTTELHLAPQLNESTMKDRSDDPSHHERPLLPRRYISLHSSMSRPWRIDPTTHRTTSDRSYHGAVSTTDTATTHRVHLVVNGTLDEEDGRPEHRPGFVLGAGRGQRLQLFVHGQQAVLAERPRLGVRLRHLHNNRYSQTDIVRQI